jgi:multicomponent Na+:H+ antiporter subunit G
MTELRLLATALLAVLGAGVILAAMVGLVRFPDVFCRAHALGKGFTLGLGLILLSVWIDLGFSEAGTKIAAALVFQFLTLPVASHLLARLSHERKVPRAGVPEIDVDRGPR